MQLLKKAYDAYKALRAETIGAKKAAETCAAYYEATRKIINHGMPVLVEPTRATAMPKRIPDGQLEIQLAIGYRSHEVAG